MDQKGAQVYVPPLADAQQVLLSSTGVLPRNKSQPRRHLTSVVKVFSIPKRRT
jgi:hypothetical protein